MPGSQTEKEWEKEEDREEEPGYYFGTRREWGKKKDHFRGKRYFCSKVFKILIT